MNKPERIQRPKRYSGGPSPSTDRGQRRHAARNQGQKDHAQAVWRGGYTVGVK